jgi:hypothetical protein
MTDEPRISGEPEFRDLVSIDYCVFPEWYYGAGFHSNPNFLVSTEIYSVFPSIISKAVPGQSEFRDLIPPGLILDFQVSLRMRISG